jgi:hypothetical protein
LKYVYKGKIKALNLDFEPKPKVDCGCSYNANKNCKSGNVNILDISNKSNVMKNSISLPENGSTNQVPLYYHQ